MDNIDRIYYINLERRKDRNEHFINQCHKHNLPFDKIERFNALDALTYKFSNNELVMFKDVDYKNKIFETKIMGNQLSHYYILKDIVKNNYKNVIIFQDDVVLKDDFLFYFKNIMNNMPQDTEIINFGLHKYAAYNTFIPWDLKTNTYLTDSDLSFQSVNNYICKMNTKYNPCSLAYLVTLQGAINFVNYFNSIGFLRATDYNYNVYLLSNNIYYASKIVLATSNINFKSDVFEKGDKMFENEILYE
jgi:GR25 family glycosyltransferase involved in LPS biosynthesis